MERSYLDLIDTSRERVKILVIVSSKGQAVTQRRKTTFVTLCNFFCTKKVAESFRPPVLWAETFASMFHRWHVTRPRSGLRDGDVVSTSTAGKRFVKKRNATAHPTRKDSREKNHRCLWLFFLECVAFYAPKGHISSWPRWPGAANRLEQPILPCRFIRNDAIGGRFGDHKTYVVAP